MSPDSWRKLEKIFDGAVLLPEKDRIHLIDRECGEDVELRKEVLKLLESEKAADDFIEASIWTDASFLNTSAKKEISSSFEAVEIDKDSLDDRLIGTIIGPFTITNEIGRGGMGAVYLAERTDGEYKQDVAIKLIKRGMDSDFIVRRFRHERQILASFEHPNIARLLDGGTTADGVPYFVMEYIHGQTLYDYCDQKRLGIIERIKLFLKICTAIDYAHQRMIVHRDIKPSNIIVNASGKPKLLDFGIAKVLDPNLIHESINPTASMLRMMTPDYASPEQLQGVEVEPASDIYSLGILLYELLSGHRPFNFSGQALHEISRTICEIVPDPPSKIIGSGDHLLSRYVNSAFSFHAARNSEDADLMKSIEGDLDSIVMKAIAKSPAERYANVAGLMLDLSNYLKGRPIQAPKFEKSINRKAVAHSDPKIFATSLAVLPFRFLNLVSTEDTGDKFLGVGLADAMIMRLSKVGRLLVRPTSSIRRFDGLVADPIRAGNELSVDYILDGSIRKAANRLRVSVQLLNVAENSAVWATSIDEDLSDVLTLEDILSRKVVEALLPQLTGRELDEFAKRGTSVPEAFEHYIRGRFHFNSFTEEGFAKAFVSFHQAVAADPTYALAYTGLADYYNWLGIIGVLPPSECFPAAIDAARKAVTLDDDLSDAHATLGFSLHAGSYDRSAAENHLIRALELNPSNSTAAVWYSIVLFTQGRFDEGSELARQGAELDPMAPFNHHNIGWGLYYAGRFADAAEQYHQVISDFPEYAMGHYGLSKVLRISGLSSASLQQSSLAVELMGDSIFAQLAHAESLASHGRISEAIELLSELNELSNARYVSPYQVALVHAHLSAKDTHHSIDHTERLFSALDEAFEHKDPWMNWLAVEPVFAPFRNDQRFERLVQKVGYSSVLKQKQIGASEEPITGGLHERTTLVIGDDGLDTSGVGPRSSSYLSFRPVVAIGLLVLFLLAGSYYSGVPSFIWGSSQPVLPLTFTKPSVMVLPFETAGTANSGVGVGLSDALAQRLGVIKELLVISPNTARMIASQDALESAKQIDVSFILRGKLAQSDTNKLTASFVEVRTGTLLWEEDFEVYNGDYFSLQKTLARKVWETLRIEPLPNEIRQVERSYTQNFNAYEKYLIGRSQMANRDANGLRLAITSFAAAVKEDPDLAPAYVGLADAYSLLNLYDISPPKDGYRRAAEYARLAIAIDDELADAHASLAYIRFFNDRDRNVAELEFRRSIQMNPSYAQAHHWFALALSAMGKASDALDEIRTAEKLDPRSLSVKAAAAIVLFSDKQYEEALAQADKALMFDPKFVPAHKVRRWIYAAMGDFAAANESLEREMLYMGGSRNDPGWQIIEMQLADPNTDREQNLRTLRSAITSIDIVGNDFAYAFEIALAFLHLGQTDDALIWLERAEAAGTHSFNLIDSDPRLECLRSEPRFQKLLTILRTPR